MKPWHQRVTFAVAVGGAVAVGIAVGTFVAGSPASAASAATCRNASLAGNYGVKFDGVSQKLGRFASVSLWAFNGRGGVTATEDYTSDKTGPQTRQIRGTYDVSSDCKFTLRFPSNLGRKHDAHGSCILVARSTQFYCLDVEKGWVTTGTGART